jgi:hypothetical protein
MQGGLLSRRLSNMSQAKTWASDISLEVRGVAAGGALRWSLVSTVRFRERAAKWVSQQSPEYWLNHESVFQVTNLSNKRLAKNRDLFNGPCTTSCHSRDTYLDFISGPIQLSVLLPTVASWEAVEPLCTTSCELDSPDMTSVRRSSWHIKRSLALSRLTWRVYLVLSQTPTGSLQHPASLCPMTVGLPAGTADLLFAPSPPRLVLLELPGESLWKFPAKV